MIDGGGRRRNRKLHETSGLIADADGVTDVTDGTTTAEGEGSAEPCPRMNAASALRGNTLYVYGGLYEVLLWQQRCCGGGCCCWLRCNTLYVYGGLCEVCLSVGCPALG